MEGLPDEPYYRNYMLEGCRHSRAMRDSSQDYSLATAPEAAETPVVAIGIGPRASHWQIQFRNNLFHNGFVFQDASVKEKQILFRLHVIGYAASWEFIVFGVLWHHPVFLEGLPINFVTALVDFEFTVDFATGNRRAVNQQRLT
jgi:hypothetical protein